MKLFSKLGLARNVVVTETVTSLSAQVPCGPAARSVVMPLSSMATVNVCTLVLPAGKFKVRLPFTAPNGVATAGLRLVTVTETELVRFSSFGIVMATTRLDWPGMPLRFAGKALMHASALGKAVLAQALPKMAVTVSPIARVYAPNSERMALVTGNATAAPKTLSR